MDTLNFIHFFTTENKKNVEIETYDDNNDEDLVDKSLGEIFKTHWNNWTTFPSYNLRKGRDYNYRDSIKASVIFLLG